MKNFLSSLWFVAAGTVYLSLNACTEGQSTGGSIEDHLRVSQRYQEQGQFRAAIIEAQNAIQKAPDNPDALKRLAQIYNELGAYKNASNLILKLGPLNDPELVLALQEAYIHLGKYKSAYALLDQHTEIQQTHPEQYYIALAVTQAGLGNGAAAELSYQKALEIDANSSAALLGLATLELQKKNFKTATAWLDKITEDDANATASALLRSDIAYARGKLTSAEEHLNSALFTLKETDLPTPQRVKTLKKLIEILTQQGRSNEAYIYSKSLADANPLGHELNLKFQQAIDKYQNGELEDAEKLLMEIHKQSAGNAISGQMLGMISYLQGDIEGAESLLDEYVDTETASTETKMLLASAQLRTNKPEEALKVLEDDATSDDARPQILAMYGLASLQMGETSKGIEFIRSALRKEPNNSGLRLAIARHYASTDQMDKARQELGIAFKKTPEDINIQTALIEALIIDNDLAEAEKVSAKIRKDYPQSSTSFSLAGHLAVATSDLNRARKYFSTAQKLDGKDISALYGLAKLEFKQKDWLQAEQYFKEITKIDSQQINAYRGILLSSAASGKPQEGVKYIDELPTELTTPKLVLAERYIELGDNETALAQLKSAQSAKPESKYAAELSARALLGQSQQQLADGKPTEAREHVLLALQIAPKNFRLLQQLALVDIASQQASEVEKTLARMTELAPNEPLISELRGDLARSQDDDQSAINSYRLAWDSDQLDSSAGKLYGLLSETNPKQARNFLQEWQTKNPNSPLLLTVMAQHKESIGDQRGAIKLYEKALDAAPNTPAVLNNLAWLYHTRGDDRAIELAERAYQLAPHSAAIADTYGWILVESGYKEKGVEVLSYAADLAPNIEEIRQHLEKAKKL